jgi:single-strand DNA-binding protein
MSVGETPITVIGNLVADPEMTFTNSGAAWARFVVASTPRSFDKTTNKWTDGTAMFMRCSAWRDLAEHVTESLTKGTRVIVVGRLRQQNWTTTEGEKRSALALEVDAIGPDVRFADVKVSKSGRGTSPALGEQDDPWASASNSRPASSLSGAGTAASGDDQPPF